MIPVVNHYREKDVVIDRVHVMKLHRGVELPSNPAAIIGCLVILFSQNKPNFLDLLQPVLMRRIVFMVIRYRTYQIASGATQIARCVPLTCAYLAHISLARVSWPPNDVSETQLRSFDAMNFPMEKLLPDALPEPFDVLRLLA